MNNEEIKYQTGGLFFTWDDHKRQKNIERHNGITFEEAAEVFCDPSMIASNPYKRDKEWRWNVIGRPSLEFEAVLFVVVTERVTIDGLDVIRLISARYATLREESDYYGI